MISDEEREVVDDLKVFYGITVGTLVLSAPMLVAGDLLPTWLFVNALSIVAHTPLLSS